MRALYGYHGNQWVGYDIVQGLMLKVNDLIKAKALRGAIFWAIDLDDFNGNFCGQGKYPLMNAVKSLLQSSVPVPSTQSPQTEAPQTQSPQTQAPQTQSPAASCAIVATHGDTVDYCQQSCLGICGGTQAPTTAAPNPLTQAPTTAAPNPSNQAPTTAAPNPSTQAPTTAATNPSTQAPTSSGNCVITDYCQGMDTSTIERC